MTTINRAHPRTGPAIPSADTQNVRFDSLGRTISTPNPTLSTPVPAAGFTVSSPVLDGDPVVLLHGIREPAATWLPMMPALADRYRLYAPDMPGEGVSAKPNYRTRDLRSYMAACLLEMFDELGIDRPHGVRLGIGGLLLGARGRS